MAFDETLAKRIDELIKGKKGFTRKQMFGGIGYMLNGNMCIGIHKDELIIRYNPTQTDQVNHEKNVRVFDISGGRPMKGWSLVNPEGTKGAGLKKWFDFSFEFVKSLPPKK